MPHLTASDVHNVAFKKPPFGRRGYNEEEVDAFLDAVEGTIVALTDEIAALRAQLGSTGPGAAPYSTERPAMRDELDEIRGRLARLEATVAASGLRPPAGNSLFDPPRR